MRFQDHHMTDGPWFRQMRIENIHREPAGQRNKSSLTRENRLGKPANANNLLRIPLNFREKPVDTGKLPLSRPIASKKAKAVSERVH
ncbi:Uncharacterised protein [Achromobacter xylosoxidans]|nr:Uncharacterised protein [Achromobacter xylosoxidans]